MVTVRSDDGGMARAWLGLLNICRSRSDMGRCPRVGVLERDRFSGSRCDVDRSSGATQLTLVCQRKLGDNEFVVTVQTVVPFSPADLTGCEFVINRPRLLHGVDRWDDAE